MALDTGALQSAIRALLDVDQASSAAAADAFAGAYDDYCVDAVFGANTPALTGRRAGFASTLAGGLAAGNAAAAAAAFSAAVAAYWTAVTVAGPVQAGTCASCPGAGAITATLAALAAAPNSKDAAAAGLAGALDTATRTCTATVSPPGGTVLPIG